MPIQLVQEGKRRHPFQIFSEIIPYLDSFTGSSTDANGSAGLVPTPLIVDKDKFLKGDGTWGEVDISNMVTTNTNQTITGTKIFNSAIFGKTAALSGNSIDVSTASCFTKTITADTTFTFTGVPTNTTAVFSLVLTNGGAYTVTWPQNVQFSGGVAPELQSSGTDVLTFMTTDGGTTWYHSASGDNVDVYQGATTSANGVEGLVPAALIADKDKFLKGDGSWATITIPEVNVYQGATTDAPGVTGTVPAATASEKDNFLRGDGTWGEVSLEPFTGCSESVSGVQGLVPGPTRGSNMYFLKSTGGWAPVSNVIYPDALKAASAITTGYLIVGDENGYKHLAAGATFDIAYPILVNIGSNASAGNTFSTAWLSMNNKRFSSSGFNNLTVTKDKMCYVMGTLSGRTFTIDSTTPITQDIPTTENGKVYMKLGIASSSNAVSFVSSNDLYEFRDGVFGPYKGADSVDPTTLVTLADNQTITGVKTFDKNTFGNTVALTGNSIDVSLANVFTKTVTGDITLTFTGVPTGKTAIFTLMLTNGGAYDVTFPNNIVWASDSGAPELKASGVDILTFFTPDGGTTWYDCGDSTNVYIGANSGADGIAGMVPPARYAQRDYFLKGDGTWAYVTENGMFTDFGGATDNANGRQGMVPAPYIADKNKFLRGDGTWYPIDTYVGATTNTNGVAGLVPSAPIADKDKFLKGDGTWQEVDIANMMTTDTVQTVTGAKTFGNTYGTIQSIDATSGEVFIDGTASTYIFTISTHTDIAFTATISSGQTKVFTLIINNTPSSNYAVYWPMNVYWNAATPPVLHDRDVITFMGIYNPLASRVEYYGTPSVIDAGTEAGVGGGSI